MNFGVLFCLFGLSAVFIGIFVREVLDEYNDKKRQQ